MEGREGRWWFGGEREREEISPLFGSLIGCFLEVSTSVEQ